MSIEAKSIWQHTYTAYINRGKTAEEAISAADKAATAFEAKFAEGQSE
jgi:hypothetical protein